MTNAAAFFVIGAITGAAILLGIAMVTGGLGRKGHKAAQRRQERREAESRDGDLAGLRAETERLHREVAELRANNSATTPVPTVVREETTASQETPGRDGHDVSVHREINLIDDRVGENTGGSHRTT